MKQCTITVLDFDKELIPEFANKEFSPCPMHSVGQIFYTESDKPLDLCNEAWTAICEYVCALASGANPENIAIENSAKAPGVAICICNCNNSQRPVIFKITIAD